MSFYQEHPGMFEWHRNEVQVSLQRLHDCEAKHTQELAEIVSELKRSQKFWQLFAPFSDAYESARREKDGQLENAVLLTMFARLYVAGSLRSIAAFEDEPVAGGGA